MSASTDETNEQLQKSLRAFEERMARKREAEEKQARLLAEQLQQDYLRRTGRTR